MTQLLGSKGLLGYIDGKIIKPVQPTTGTTKQPEATSDGHGNSDLLWVTGMGMVDTETG